MTRTLMTKGRKSNIVSPPPLPPHAPLPRESGPNMNCHARVPGRVLRQCKIIRHKLNTFASIYIKYMKKLF